MFRILRANDDNATFAARDLTFAAHGFDGGSDLHTQRKKEIKARRSDRKKSLSSGL